MRLLKTSVCLAVIVAVMCLSLYSQSSKDGSFHGNTFTDRYFNISFDLPPFLGPQPVSSLNFHAPETIDAWPMAVGREGSESYGIVLISQRLKPGRYGSAQEYLQIVRRTRSQGDVVEGTGHLLNKYGLTFDWLDWKVNGHGYSSAVITQRGDYLIVARCDAKTQEALSAMKNALFGMRAGPK
jgi:hypothetical protein